ncbi:MAG: mechanosensitive ion channel family protein [Bdellovibrionota bacterium]
MNPKSGQPFIPFDKIDDLIQIEPALLLVGLSFISWLIYKILLRTVSAERHRNLKALFKNLSAYLLGGILLFFGYRAMSQIPDTNVRRLATYVGLLVLLTGATVFVKIWRIFVFEYLFLSHMRVAVPVLLVNLFTLVLSMFLVAWFATEILNLKLVPLIATSAIFSLVLGLALQDTLGNLFAGVALQVDKPYEIGDWIEVHGSGQKWVGQVFEITWRATVLTGFADESITVPNRVMSQAEISNFSTKYRPIIRSQTFKIPYGVNEKTVKQALQSAAASVSLVRKNPPPYAMMLEATESWVAYKVIYFIDDYGAQYSIGDQVIAEALTRLEAAKIPIASARIAVEQVAA